MSGRTGFFPGTRRLGAPRRAGSVWVRRAVALPDAARRSAQESIRLGLGQWLGVRQWPSAPTPPAIAATCSHP